MASCGTVTLSNCFHFLVMSQNSSWEDSHNLMYIRTCSVLMSSLLLYQLLEESQMRTSKRYLFSCILLHLRGQNGWKAQLKILVIFQKLLVIFTNFSQNCLIKLPSEDVLRIMITNSIVLPIIFLYFHFFHFHSITPQRLLFKSHSTMKGWWF
jgi:hypothetical protein